jgi:hypothetical protein
MRFFIYNFYPKNSVVPSILNVMLFLLSLAKYGVEYSIKLGKTHTKIVSDWFNCTPRAIFEVRFLNTLQKALNIMFYSTC